MTPQERELIADLFDRLAQLERQPRDPEAERVIREGLSRAPNAVYALVQSVLVQDEALKAANDHIAALEEELQSSQQPQQKRGFLDNMRDSILGRDEPPPARGSVPSVGDRPMGAPPGYGRERPDPWGQARQSPQYRDEGYGGGAGPGYGGPQRGGPMAGGPMAGGGGSFLGTAAAAAAGAIGGGLLMGGIRSAMGQSSGSPASGAFDQIARGGTGGSAAGGELSRDAGLNDIGGSGSRFSQAEADRQQDADQDQDDQQDADQDQDDEQDAADFDSDDSFDDSDTA